MILVCDIIFSVVIWSIFISGCFNCFHQNIALRNIHLAWMLSMSILLISVLPSSPHQIALLVVETLICIHILSSVYIFCCSERVQYPLYALLHFFFLPTWDTALWRLSLELIVPRRSLAGWHAFLRRRRKFRWNGSTVHPCALRIFNQEYT
jgi:hypothetical protein